jgi:hypothetical protein
MSNCILAIRIQRIKKRWWGYRSATDESDARSPAGCFAEIGDPITYDYFRAKQYENIRLYFFINETTDTALLVDIGSKKEQRAIIKHCLANKDTYVALLQ